MADHFDRYFPCCSDPMGGRLWVVVAANRQVIRVLDEPYAVALKVAYPPVLEYMASLKVC